MNSYISDNEPSTRHIVRYVASSTFRKSVSQIITTILRSDICCICWRNSVVISQDTNSFKSHKLWTKLKDNIITVIMNNLL